MDESTPHFDHPRARITHFTSYRPTDVDANNFDPNGSDEYRRGIIRFGNRIRIARGSELESEPGRSMVATPGLSNGIVDAPQPLVKVFPEEVGMTIDYKNLYSGKEDKRGRYQWQTTIPEDVGKPAEDAESERYAIIVRNVKTFEDPKRVLSIHSILIQSPLLKELLSKVLAGYPNITVGLKRMEFTGRFEPIIHRWNELLAAIEDLTRQVPNNAPDSIEAQRVQHAELLSDLISREFNEIIESSRDMKSKGVMTYDLLWTLFQPGAFVFCKQQGQDRVLSLKSAQYGQDQRGSPVYWLQCNYVDYDGAKFGTNKLNLSIPKYEGTRPVISLPMLPLDFHGNKEEVRAKLIERGSRVESLAGSHFRAYDGIGWRPDAQGMKEYHSVKGRIVIDTFGWNRFNPNLHVSVKPLPATPTFSDTDAPPLGSAGWLDRSQYDEGFDLQDGGVPEDGFFGDEDEFESKRQSLTDEQKMMCTPHVRGYALREKVWLNFYANSVQDISFDNRAFDSLKLPHNQKELILGFASTHQSYRSQFDDVIAGKGRGIILLLSGPPGVGKTLTAESVAEHMQVPLYVMAAGDLGLDPRSVEMKLNGILDMCTRWNAILLLDEADVFLEERSLHELERNKLVSIFLRVLEYYQGIMFLTTNRVQTFDAAFQSRIHISIEYKELDLAARVAVWRNFLQQHDIAQAKARENPPRMLATAAKANSSKSPTRGIIAQTEDELKTAEEEHTRHTQAHIITEQDIMKLGSFKLNGRQIKNFLKTAQLLANSRAEPLSFEHVDNVLDMTQHLHNASRENTLAKASYFS